ncbi:TetR/AcrR family transcriptional regulator [Microbacterium stercoris]|uniref:TetR family transcriptional regulator C-terminal domain-containing protein n=1 Tax=Microbacterium stercoris TaxID=2820289 RepID=A0A939QTK3_9MICO|nr:TetR family transcriptional regulator C-terminal domain-containing protein [Microbacterium stercoris]MBO3664928.1 TetR family transcriptional regulator C-terminal domain-containing protein [Microbacterium stercoris]
MPKIVDRDARRREIVETYLRLAAAEGVEAVTTRRLASELGVATGGLWHYFSGFDEVLLRAFELIFDRADERIAGVLAQRRGIDALCGLIDQTHPLDGTTGEEAHVVVSFWGRVPFHHELSAVQSRVEEHWHRTYRLALEQAVADGELRAGTPVDALADALLVFVAGYQIEHVLATSLARPDRQWRAVGAVLGPWLTEEAAARGEFARRAAAPV